MTHTAYSISLMLCCLSSGVLCAQTSWQKIPGPFQGPVSGITVDARGHLFASSSAPGSGSFLSQDNGETWEWRGPYEAPNSTNMVGMDGNGRVVVQTFGLGICLSSNDGQTWNTIFQSTSPTVTAFAFDKSGSLYAATSTDGILKYNDDLTWTYLHSGLPSVLTFAIHPNGNLYAGAESGLYISSDKGSSWTLSGLKGDWIHALAIDSSGRVFAAMDGKGIFSSTDNGSSWSPANSGIPGDYLTSLAASSNGQIFAVLNDSWHHRKGLYRSTDHGASWNETIAGLPDSIFSTVAVAPGGDAFLGTWTHGVYRLLNGSSTWTPINAGLTNDYVFVLAMDSLGDMLAGGNNGVYRTTDDGMTWSILSPDLEIFDLQVNARNQIFAAVPGGVSCSTDSGQTWVLHCPWGDPAGNDPVYSIAITPSGAIIADGHGLYRSTDNGVSWMHQSDITTQGQESKLQIGANGTVLILAEDTLFRSTDDGITWSKPQDRLGGAIYLAADSRGNVVVGDLGTVGIIFSTNNGGIWSAQRVINNSILKNVFLDPNGNVYAATNSGLFLSSDQGNTWSNADLGFADTIVWALSFGKNGTQYAATTSNVVAADGRLSIYRRPQSQSGVKQQIESEPAIVSVEPIFPNPFQRSATLEFALTQREFVRIELLDEIGKKLTTVTAGMFEPGTHDIELDASMLGDGTY